MKKLLVTAIALSMVLTMVSCGNNESSDSSKAENSKVTETVNDSAEDKAEETPEDTQPEETSSGKTYGEDYLDWWGLKLFIPAENLSFNLPDGTEAHHSRNSKDYPSWKEIVGSGNDTDVTKAYACAVAGGFIDKPEITPEEAKDYFEQKDLIHIVDKAYAATTLASVDVESSEKVQVVGKDFLRESGVIHTKSARGDQDVAYVAYYGTPGFTSVMAPTTPVMWIAYSNHLDDDTKAVLAEMADKAANDAEING